MAAKEKQVAGLPETCNATTLGAILDVSRRNVLDWAARGLLVKAEAKGQYKTLESIHAYLKGLRAEAGGRSSKGGRHLADERAEVAFVDRQIKELKLAQMRGDVLTLDEVAASWSEFATMVKAAMLAVPGRVRSEIPHVTAHDAETIKRLVRNSLIDLAEEVEKIGLLGDPEKLEK